MILYCIFSLILLYNNYNTDYNFFPETKNRLFQGWYTRIIDHEQNISASIIIASTNINGQHQTITSLLTPNYTNHNILSRCDISFPYDSSNNFYISTRVANMNISSNHSFINFAEQNDSLIIDITNNNPMKNKDSIIHNIVSHILDINWIVYDMYGYGKYQLIHNDINISGNAIVHQEYNSGFFPDSWIWIQGSNKNISFVVTVGYIYNLKIWKGYVGPDISYSIADLNNWVTYNINNNKLVYNFYSIGTTFSLELLFDYNDSVPVYCPTKNGFKQTSKQIFTSYGTLKVCKKTCNIYQLNNVAIEFGNLE